MCPSLLSMVSSPTTHLLGHLGGSLYRDGGTALFRNRLTGFLGDRSTILHWFLYRSLHCHLLTVLLGNGSTCLGCLLNRNVLAGLLASISTGITLMVSARGTDLLVAGGVASGALLLIRCGALCLIIRLVAGLIAGAALLFTDCCTLLFIAS